MKKVKVSDTRKLKIEKSMISNGDFSKINWETAYRTDRTNTRALSECHLCNTVADYYLENLSNGTYVCKTCSVNKYKTACEKLNLRFIATDKIAGQIYLLAECSLCGGKCKAYSGHIIKGEFRCEGCSVKRYKEILSKRGCKFISLEKTKGYRTSIHYQNSAGEHFKATNSAIINGAFAITVDTHWNQKHYVYLIMLEVETGGFICKIGTANNPESRATYLRLIGEYVVFTIGVFDNRKVATNLESELHKEFSSCRLAGDCVSEYTSRYGYRKLKDGNRYKVKDGITEWFSSEVYETLKVRYNLT